MSKEVTGYTFLGWYRGETLLSKALRYELDVTSLRVSLPQVTAKYVEGATANASVESTSEVVRVYVQDGVLHIEPFGAEPMEIGVATMHGRLIFQGRITDAIRVPVSFGICWIWIRRQGVQFVQKLIID